MNIQEFNAIVNYWRNQIHERLGQKGAEYARIDRLSNFKSAALLNDCTTKQALWGFVTKHIVSLKDMINDNMEYSQEQWDEKIGDVICYMVLLDAIVYEDTVNRRQDQEVQAVDAEQPQVVWDYRTAKLDKRQE